ncbi:MAG: urea ABC transporter ATP-binding protein UrtD [Nitrospiria bacterium]
MTGSESGSAPLDGETSGLAHFSTSGEVDTSHGVLLYLEEVTVSFDGFKALNQLSFTLDEGELRCVIGPNGAGKTTMMDVITGKARPESGKIFFGQSIDLTRLSEYQISRTGIGRKFQKPSVFEKHTLFENLELALKGNKGVFNSLFFRLNSDEFDLIETTLEKVGLLDKLKTPAGLLSHGQKQWLEIGMLLIQEPKLLLLDEPVAGMTDQEKVFTAGLLKSLSGKHSIIVVEHDMDFVSTIASRVTVLHEGKILVEGKMETIRNDEKVIEVYLGK